MNQRCTRVDPRYGCQQLERDLFLRMAANPANPATPTTTLPTAEDKAAFEAAKKDLVQALTRKRNADKQLVSPTFLPGAIAHNLIQAQVEVQLYHLEASYLTDTTTNSGGNIITGFDNYLKNQGTGRRKFEVTDSDRMFSASSTTYQRVRTTYDLFCIIDFNPIATVSRTHGGRRGIHRNTG